MSRRDEDGFSSCSTCPCHRAAPNHPAGVAGRFVSSRPVMLPSPRRRGLGLRNHILSRPPLGSLALRPGDSLAIQKMALSVGFIRVVSSTDATQATGFLTVAPEGLTPTEHVCLSLDALLCENSARGLRGLAVVEPQHAAKSLTAPYSARSEQRGLRRDPKPWCGRSS